RSSLAPDSSPTTPVHRLTTTTLFPYTTLFRSIQDGDQLATVLEAHRGAREARVVDQVLAPDGATEGAPVPVRLEHDEVEPAPVAGAVEVEERVGGRAAPARGVAVAGRDRGLDVAREHPDAAREERHADLLADEIGRAHV